VKQEVAAPQLPATPSSRPDEHHLELNQVKLLTFDTTKNTTVLTQYYQYIRKQTANTMETN
jgi:hypothetical protein